jgi:hypothetical protein
MAEATESLSTAAGKGVTGLFSNARRLKAQLATAVDEFTVAATTVAGSGAIASDDEAGPQVKTTLPAAVAGSQLAIGEMVPQSRAHSLLPSPASQDDDLHPCRAFPASMFLRDIGDIRGRLVFTATQLMFVPLTPKEKTFKEARELLWTTLSPRVKHARGGDATLELHRLAFAHEHVVYFGMENPPVTTATLAGNDVHDGGDVARIVVQSSVKAGTVPGPVPNSERAREPEPVPEPEPEPEPSMMEASRTHRLHGDLEALGLTPGRSSADDVDDATELTGSIAGDQIVAPQIRHNLPDDDGGECQVRLKVFSSVYWWLQGVRSTTLVCNRITVAFGGQQKWWATKL